MKKLLTVILCLGLAGCATSPDRTEQFKQQAERISKQVAQERVDIDARLAEAKNAYDTKQITYAEYLNLKNNIEILRQQYAQEANNQLDEAYYQSNH